MILSFLMGGEVIQVRVDEDRTLFFKGGATNGEWIEFGTLVGMVRGDTESARMSQLIVRSLPSIDDVAWYVRDEFRRQGFEFVRQS